MVEVPENIISKFWSIIVAGLIVATNEVSFAMVDVPFQREYLTVSVLFLKVVSGFFSQEISCLEGTKSICFDILILHTCLYTI